MGERTHITPAPVDDKSGEGRHLFSPAGFLDDFWLHRVYWIHGRNAGEGWGGWIKSGWYSPYGRILVFDNSNVYGYQRDPEYLCNGSVLEYRLFAASKDVRAERIDHVRNIKINGKSNNWESRSHYPDSDLTAIDYHWVEEDPPLLVHAMVLANNTLFIAGPPYIVNENDIFGKFHTYQTQAKIKWQVDALHGMEGSILQAVSASDGKKLAEYRLKSLPIFDGLIAAKGKLYLCTKKGEIICFGS
jgi:hypothetical protein